MNIFSSFKKVTLCVAVLIVSIVVMPKTTLAYTAGAFVTQWTVSANNLTITIPTNPDYAGQYSYNVDWGDSTTPDSGDTSDALHTYASPGVYNVTITGTFPAISFGLISSDVASELTDILQWGTNSWQSMNGAFVGCAGLTTLSATDTPDLSQVTDMSVMFHNDTNFNSNIDNWNVSNVTYMSSMFDTATAFNQPLNSWNVAKVTNMQGMFWSDAAFNQPLDSWKVSSVTNMSGMFFGAISFNQDISSWDVSSVTSMTNMFNGYALSIANYDNILVNWSTENLQEGVVFNAGQSHYCSAPGKAGRAYLISNFGWTIYDDGGCPYMTSAAVNGSTLTLTYNEDLLASSLPTASDFVVHNDRTGDDVTISNIAIVGPSVIFTLATPTLVNDSISLTYTPGTNPIEDADENLAVSLSSYGVTNQTPATLDYAAGPNGSISGSSSQVVAPGDLGATVTAVPNAGYAFIGWSDGQGSASRNDYANYNISVTANFVPDCGIISVINNPSASVVVGTRLYVLGGKDGNISVVDTLTNTVIATITDLQDTLNGGVLVGTDLYITSDQYVYIIDTLTNTVTNTITVGRGVMSPVLVGNKVYVINRKDKTVSAVDTVTKTVTATISVGSDPASATLSGTKLYVVNSNKKGDHGSVTVIDTTTDTTTTAITLDENPSSATLVGTKLYVEYNNGNSISVIDTTTDTIVDTITVGNIPSTAVLVGTSLYVLNFDDTSISVIDTTNDTVTTTFTAGASFGPVTLVGKNLYIINSGNHNSNTISVINTDTNSLIGTITVGPRPISSVLVGTMLYVLNGGSNSVSIINTLTNDTLICSAPSSPSSPTLVAAPTVSGGGSNITWMPQTGFVDHSKDATPTVTTPSSSPSVTALFTKNLKRGSVSSDVKRLQIYLRLHGFVVTPEGKETTTFGPKTKTELSLFQKSVGLTPDGVFGTATRKYVNSHN